ncbi:Histone H1 [Sesamum alatum]|uniref:Histone H1 n=1 Tax=Sesamum alatum TaxID=300844 RepID=A0AAE2CC61_9LAMI|nr:Histone H1 [Sesamum alatum]
MPKTAFTVLTQRSEHLDNPHLSRLSSPAVVEKPVKEKKPKAAAAKEKKAKTTKTASHPPYFEMIKEALLALNEKSGSSPYAIAKYMEEKHKAVLPANFRKILGLQLKNSATKGKLTKVKASYKLSESGKTDKPTAKPAAKKSAAPAAETKKPRTTRATAAGTKRKAEGVKKVTAKKVAKKATPAKAKAKQPKSIKSPAAKKAKKASAA